MSDRIDAIREKAKKRWGSSNGYPPPISTALRNSAAWGATEALTYTEEDVKWVAQALARGDQQFPFWDEYEQHAVVALEAFGARRAER